MCVGSIRYYSNPPQGQDYQSFSETRERCLRICFAGFEEPPGGESLSTNQNTVLGRLQSNLRERF